MDFLFSPEGWKLKESCTFETYRDPTTGEERQRIVVKTDVVGCPGGSGGSRAVEGAGVTRRYYPETGTWEMYSMFLDRLPEEAHWIRTGNAESALGGRGMPTQAWINLRQMRQAERLAARGGRAQSSTFFGKLNRVRMSHVVNGRTCLQLHWLKKRFPSADPNLLIRQTHSFEYAMTSITQSGHDVGDVRVSGGAANLRAEDLDGITASDLREYGVAPHELVLNGFDIEIDLKPNPRANRGGR